MLPVKEIGGPSPYSKKPVKKVLKQHTTALVRFQVNMGESVEMTAFWCIMPRNIVEEDRRFRSANGHDPMALMLKVVLNVWNVDLLLQDNTVQVNVVVNWFAILSRILEVPCSNFRAETGCHV
jgi:hypothetical protein